MPRQKTRDEQLRRQVLDRTFALLEVDGAAAVTARRVATASDTSTAAVYELFGSKAGLVRSIFLGGFEQFASELDRLKPIDDAELAIVALLDATRRFALSNPALFEVMFARPFAEFCPMPEDYRIAERIYDHVTARVASLLGTGRTDQTTVDAAHSLVALDRGLIASELNGLLGRSANSIARRRSAAFAAWIAGWQAVASQPLAGDMSP